MDSEFVANVIGLTNDKRCMSMYVFRFKDMYVKARSLSQIVRRKQRERKKKAKRKIHRVRFMPRLGWRILLYATPSFPPPKREKKVWPKHLSSARPAYCCLHSSGFTFFCPAAAAPPFPPLAAGPTRRRTGTSSSDSDSSSNRSSSSSSSRSS